jgi:hypothetical protein
MKAEEYFYAHSKANEQGCVPPDECIRMMEEYVNHRKKESMRFSPPTETEVIEYFVHRTEGSWEDGRRFAQKFMAHYEQTDWHYGKRKMKDWKRAAISAWDMNKYVTQKTLGNGTLGKGTSIDGFNRLAEQLGQGL